MTFALGTLLAPADGGTGSGSKAVPETMEILFGSMTHLLWGLCNSSCEVLQTPVWLLCSAPSKIVEAIPIFALSGFPLCQAPSIQGELLPAHPTSPSYEPY